MDSLYELLYNGFGIDEDYNCAEKILYGANNTYKLELSKSALKLSAGFGGGMGIESICGAITGAIMVLSNLLVVDIAHENDLIKETTSSYIENVISKLASSNCKILKDKYRTDDKKCMHIILVCAQLLDEVYIDNFKNRRHNE